MLQHTRNIQPPRFASVISIGKMATAEQAIEYLQVAVADRAIDYYATTTAGRWSGRGARRLDLRDRVRSNDLRTVLVGKHPQTGRALRGYTGYLRNAAFDITFSVPKSVSLLYALGDDDIRRHVIAAHEAAVDAVIEYMERHAAFGRQQNRSTKEVYRVDAELMAASFRHCTSRPVTDRTTGETLVDPQLHSHILIPSLVRRPDGTWGAIDSAYLYSHAATAGTVGQAVLRKELIDRLGVGVTINHDNGTFEVAGFTASQTWEFSRRRQEIQALEEAYDITTREGRQLAVLATRRVKEEPQADETLFATWRERAKRVRLTPEYVASLCTRNAPAPERPEPNLNALHRLIGPEGLTAQAATFRRRDVVRAIAATYPPGLDPAVIERLADEVLDDKDVVVALGPETPPPNPTQDHPARPDHEAPATVHKQSLRRDDLAYSTREMVQLEAEMLERARAGKGTGSGVAKQKAVDAAVATRAFLNEEQRAMVNAVCRSGDGVTVVEGVAGAGKTAALAACAEAFVASGYEVRGFALAGRAAETLQEEAGITSQTLASGLRKDGVLHTGLNKRTVVVIDEAGMVGSRQLAEVVAACAERKAKLVLVGDSCQLQPIDAGAAFRALGDHLGRTELHLSVRHAQAWERAALLELRHGNAGAAAHTYWHNERLVAAATKYERRQLAALQRHHEALDGKDAVVLTRTRDEAHAINALSRQLAAMAGRLDGPRLKIGSREYQAGDLVICTQNNRGMGLTNGLRGTVTRVDPEAGSLTLRTAKGTPVAIDVNQYKEIDHAYALTAHKAQGVTVDVAFVIGSEAETREWAYSAMSRARERTVYFTIQHPLRDQDGTAHGHERPRDHRARLAGTWTRSDAKTSTLDYDPAA